MARQKGQKRENVKKDDYTPTREIVITPEKVNEIVEARPSVLEQLLVRVVEGQEKMMTAIEAIKVGQISTAPIYDPTLLDKQASEDPLKYEKRYFLIEKIGRDIDGNDVYDWYQTSPKPYTTVAEAEEAGRKIMPRGFRVMNKLFLKN